MPALFEFLTKRTPNDLELSDSSKNNFKLSPLQTFLHYRTISASVKTANISQLFCNTCTSVCIGLMMANTFFSPQWLIKKNKNKNTNTQLVAVNFFLIQE